MEPTYRKKMVGTSVFALAIAVGALSFFGIASALHDNGNPSAPGKTLGKGHVYGHTYGGQPDTPPPGQVGNENSNRAGTPGNGRGK